MVTVGNTLRTKVGQGMGNQRQDWGVGIGWRAFSNSFSEVMATVWVDVNAEGTKDYEGKRDEDESPEEEDVSHGQMREWSGWISIKTDAGAQVKAGFVQWLTRQDRKRMKIFKFMLYNLHRWDIEYTFAQFGLCGQNLRSHDALHFISDSSLCPD